MKFANVYNRHREAPNTTRPLIIGPNTIGMYNSNRIDDFEVGIAGIGLYGK